MRFVERIMGLCLLGVFWKPLKFAEAKFVRKSIVQNFCRVLEWDFKRFAIKFTWKETEKWRYFSRCTGEMRGCWPFPRFTWQIFKFPSKEPFLNSFQPSNFIIFYSNQFQLDPSIQIEFPSTQQIDHQAPIHITDEIKCFTTDFFE